MKQVSKRRLGHGLLVMLLLVVGLVASGCGSLRIHRPADLANAKKAQTQFQSAAVAETIAGERRRLDEVLAEELDLVRRHTLARRDQRLLFFISEAGTEEAWQFLKKDMLGRINELLPPEPEKPEIEEERQAFKQDLAQQESRWKTEEGKNTELPALHCPLPPELPLPSELDPETKPSSMARLIYDGYTTACTEYLDFEEGLLRERFERYLQNQVDKEIELEDLEKQALRWKVEQAKDPELPDLQCPQPPELDKETDSRFVPAIHAAYTEACNAYVTAVGETSGNQARIDAMKAARSAARAEVHRLRREYEKAKKEYDKAPETTPKTDVEAAFAKLADFAGRFENFGKKLEDGTIGTMAPPLGMRLQEAATALGPLGLDGVVAELKGSALLAKLGAERGEKLDATRNIVNKLGALGKAVSADDQPAQLAELLIEVEQLRLEQASAKKGLAFFDQTLALLTEQEEAVQLELDHLGDAEQLRGELEATTELTDPDNPQGPRQSCLEVVEFRKFFGEVPMVRQRCQERVFRLLVAYSNAWELGRVKQEQIRYRLIGLHHQAALDSSELAFAKWQNLIGVPIDRLVAFHETGLRTEQIMAVINALGLGTIAVGVN